MIIPYLTGSVYTGLVTYPINRFYKDYFNVYLNYHRPCGFAKIKIDKKGKQKKIYPLSNYQTPYEKLLSLSKSEKYLKENISFKVLNKIAYQESDNEFTEKMKQAKEKLFKKI